MEQKIKISVRKLVEFVLRSGDIDNRLTSSERMLEGTRAHQKIQRSAAFAYLAEVSLSGTFSYQGFEITLFGRADGIIDEDGRYAVDEIKSTTRSLDKLDEGSHPVFWAQAECYAFLFARQEHLDSIAVQLTYTDVETGEVRSFRRELAAGALEQKIFSLLDRYLRFAAFESERLAERDKYLRSLAFPFPRYRKGQRELAAAVYRSIAAGRNLFALAPTGTGKTISTLFPALKAVAEGYAQKIFYLTAKTVTRGVAEEAFRKMAVEGNHFKAITLTAKDKICPHPGTQCAPQSCPFAKGYYDRLNDALLDFLAGHDLITRETVEEYAEAHTLCPFEFSLDLSEWVDCVICDYNYVFDPIVYLKRYFQNTSGDYVFLIDEAHNLDGRAREMFSASLKKSDFLKIKKLTKTQNRKTCRAASDINALFVTARKECLASGGSLVSAEENETLCQLVSRFARRAEKFLLHGQGAEGYDDLLELYFSCLAFLKISSLFDERYVTFTKAEKTEVTLTLYCIDPSYLLSQALSRGRTAVFFSATLSPLDYFREILGGGAEDRTIRLPSPFDSAHLCLLVDPTVSTRYKNREQSYDRVVEDIAALVGAKAGNYIVYFPSYRYMDAVYSRFCEAKPEICTLRQDSRMSDREREEFLGRFEDAAGQTLVGFCVLGGVFSEGIDLKGDRLIGTAIVGVGLPQISPELDVIWDYYAKVNGMGYEYAYMYPGMNKVLQAAGRVIRSEEDRGAVLLIDDRFSLRSYRSLFPPHWRGARRTGGPEAIAGALADFWERDTAGIPSEPLLAVKKPEHASGDEC
jgi:Rad3-related DNA helicase